MNFLQSERPTPKRFVCPVCGSTENLVTSLPTNPDLLKKWVKILNTPSLEHAESRTKICILHFEAKWHRVLTDPNFRRSQYCFPMPWKNERDPLELVSVKLEEPVAQSSVSTEVITTGSNHKLEPNYPLMISMRDDEIKTLKETINTLRAENQKLIKMRQAIPSARQILAKTELGVPAKTIVSLLLNPRHIYSDEEKDLCRKLYSRSPSNYKYLRLLLDKKLPSKRRIFAWNAVDRLKKAQNTEVKMESETKDAS